MPHGEADSSPQSVIYRSNYPTKHWKHIKHTANHSLTKWVSGGEVRWGNCFNPFEGLKLGQLFQSFRGCQSGQCFWFVTTTKCGAGVLFPDGNLKVGVALAKSKGVPSSILVFLKTDCRCLQNMHTSIDFVLNTGGDHVERVQLRNSSTSCHAQLPVRH